MAGGDRGMHTQLSPSAAMRARDVSVPTPADVDAALQLVESSPRARGGRPYSGPDRRRQHRPTPADLAAPDHPEPPGRSGSSPDSSNDVS